MMYIGTDLFRFEYEPTLNERAGPLVRSITWHMEYSASRACTPEEVAERGMGGCVNVCMYTLNNFPDMFPNLRRVRLEYRNYPYADLFHNLRLYHLPPIIEAVDVRYRFDENVSEEVMDLQRREQDLTHFAPWELKNVREMSIIGGTKAVAKELLSHTPKLKQLIIDRHCASKLRIRANVDDPKYCRVTLV
ncbi:uncharacterized protein SCHCODRAFT_02621999 [Schizophyllum commune H4-8]|nr:uncharacterized protein SCHCODRAFT_02621999 [Schizophyllum commune H4-8]KAI5893501.1 hypothetical protein SCHCODRAFT_02621999 [Schizophyllum commune H4-8]